MNKKYALPLLLCGLLVAACADPTASSSGSSSSEAESETTSSSSSSSDSSSSSSSSSSSEGGSVSLPTYDEGTEKAQKAVASLQKRSYKAHIDFETWVERNNMDELGIYSGRVYDIAFGYGEDPEDIGYSTTSTLTYCDIRMDEEGNQNLIESTRYSIVDPLASYFRAQDGTITRESLSVQNEVSYTTMAEYDDTTGIFTPYAFEDMYKNPWDYIRPSDLYEENGKLYLSKEKADFLVDCYGGTSTNWIGECEVVLNGDDEVESLVFTIPDQVGARCTRKCTAEVTYSAWGENTVPHLAPLTYDNPELAEALLATKDYDNFTYRKSFDESDYTEQWGTGSYFYDCYYTPTRAFYNYNDEDLAAADDTNVVQIETHYMADYEEDDGLFHVYTFVYNDGLGWSWTPVSLSSSAYYTVDGFSGLGPQMYLVSPELFEQSEDDPYTYTAKGAVTGMGTYFDNQMAGCHSEALATSTTEVIIHLDPEAATPTVKSIETGFTIQGVEQKLTFTLSDIGTTAIPARADFPNA